MKKKFLSLLLVLLSAVVLFGCETQTESLEIEGILTPGSVVDITFWHSWGQSKTDVITNDEGTGIIETFVKMMEKEYGVTVNFNAQSYEDYGTLKSMCTDAIVAKTLPNIALGYPDHFASYIDSNVVLPLTQYINSPTYGIDLDDFIPGFLAENYQFGEVYYSLPFVKSTEIMIYNKTAMEAAYATEMAADESFTIYNDVFKYDEAITWAELKNIWQTKFNGTSFNGSGASYKAMGAYDSLDNMFINFSRQYKSPYTAVDPDTLEGELLLDKTNENTLIMLALIQSYFNNGTLSIPEQYNTDATTESNFASKFFQTQEMVCTIGSTAGVQYNLPDNDLFEVDIAPVPQPGNTATTTNSVVQQGPDVCIFNTGTNKQKLVSWLFLKYCLCDNYYDLDLEDEEGEAGAFNPEIKTNALLAWNTDYFPVTISARDSEYYQQYINIARRYYNGETISNTDKEKLIKAKVAYISLYVQSPYFAYDPAFCANDYYHDSAMVRDNTEEVIRGLATNKAANAAQLIQDLIDASSI